MKLKLCASQKKSPVFRYLSGVACEIGNTNAPSCLMHNRSITHTWTELTNVIVRRDK